jgi:hypothetical protein
MCKRYRSKRIDSKENIQEELPTLSKDDLAKTFPSAPLLQKKQIAQSFESGIKSEPNKQENNIKDEITAFATDFTQSKKLVTKTGIIFCIE